MNAQHRAQELGGGTGGYYSNMQPQHGGYYGGGGGVTVQQISPVAEHDEFTSYDQHGKGKGHAGAAY